MRKVVGVALCAAIAMLACGFPISQEPDGGVPGREVNARCACDVSLSCDETASSACVCDGDCPRADAVLVVYPHDAAGNQLSACTPPNCSLELGTIEIGETGIGAFTIANQGSGSAVLIATTISGDGNGNWALQWPDAMPLTLEPGATHPVRVGFTAAGVGPGSAVVTVADNVSNSPAIALQASVDVFDATDPPRPLAIAKLREPDPTDPNDPCSPTGYILPLSTVCFDGTDSYDPLDPYNPAAIVSWEWEVIMYPGGTNVSDFNETGSDGALYSIWLPTVGQYAVHLRVWNSAGLQSLVTVASRFDIQVIPTSGLYVQLTWDNVASDQDLHLVNLGIDNRLCHQTADCHWLNKSPVWSAESPTGSGPNPQFYADSTSGLGPENIGIEAPQAGTYRIYVHYYGDFNFGGATPTRETVHVILNGLQLAEYRRTLTQEKAMWAVADIIWNADGTAHVTPYPSDSPGEVGSVAIMQDCVAPGWQFP